jgi:hypothetical protein
MRYAVHEFIRKLTEIAESGNKNWQKFLMNESVPLSCIFFLFWIFTGIANGERN